MAIESAAPSLASALAGFGLSEPHDQEQADALMSRLERLSNRSPACQKLKVVLTLLGQRIRNLTEADLASELASC